MIRIASFLLFLFSPLALAQSISRFEERVNDIVGIWFTGEAIGGSGWVLRVTNILRGDAHSANLVAYFGPAGERGQELEVAVAKPDGPDSIRVQSESEDGWKISLSTNPAGALRGSAISPAGVPYSMAFRRSSLAKVHRWLAKNPGPGTRASRDSKIELVYISASDCDWCRGWERDYLDERKTKFKGTTEWKALHFVELNRGRFKSRLKVDDAPAAMREAFRTLEQRRSPVFFVTPSYVVLVNGSVRAHSAGVHSFDTLIHPAIKAALREKAAAERI